MEGAQRMNQIRYPVIDTSEIMEIRTDIVETIPPNPRAEENNIYVAVGKEVKESQLALRWALDNLGGWGILYTHQIVAHRAAEMQEMNQILDKYKQICQKAGVFAEVHYIEMNSIEKGIVDFILKHNVRKLAMGAAADKQFSKRMVDVRSKKAVYVKLKAAAFCQIQFICKGNVIFTRQGTLDGVGFSTASPSASPNTTSGTDNRRVMSNNRGTELPAFSSPSFNTDSTSTSRLTSGRAFDEWSGISRSTNSRFSSCSSELADDLGQTPYSISEVNEVQSDYGAVTVFIEEIPNHPPSSVMERGMNDELYDQLEQAMAEVDTSKREAFEESIRRRKAEKDAMDARRKVKALENMYGEELRRRQEIDETLTKTNQITDLNHTVQEVEQKMFSAIELLKHYKGERDEMQVECDHALQLVEELSSKQTGEASSSGVSQFYNEFSLTEIQDATRNFDQSLKIGEGGYGSIFRGFLRHTEVAIKMLHSHSLQGPSEFQQEVNVLSKLRHPNLVTLIGVCPDAWTIVYEYLPGGSLEDRLGCKDNTPPLSWQNRIRIAAELCSVIIFLHSCGIIHGDLKPDNLLLDKNLVTKVSDFGICRVLSGQEFSDNNTSICRTGPKGTFLYMDPEFLSTGELTSKSDTYSFGVILLRLLTGKPALGLTKEVKCALNEKKLKNILDPAAGDWPFVQAQQLAVLAMNCCDMIRQNRPDLVSEVWRVLEPMAVSCGLSSFRVGSEGQSEIPHYFVCPIFQETMQDPVVAADGFTYEAEAIKGWLDSGHNTSPMTNLELANSNLVPNHALRSAIQEWLQ
ncbi:U-box domain-containing protein kinase family protein [Artemisia annua]|uniref:RING-type E3 ubiquitin transferase n=1 Tax=Artemisia annua TaxID=35608 RepID=A0A2U1KCX2_ARTAN|nr:U-box domain-containing protein kinase family protein [Artemisia annua]